MTDFRSMFVGGRFQFDAEERFPFSSINQGGVWYALLGTKDGSVRGEGFSATIQDLARLCIALESGDGSRTLIGVWTGSYNTDLFPLDAKVAAAKIRSALEAHEIAKQKDAKERKAMKDRKTKFGGSRP